MNYKRLTGLLAVAGLATLMSGCVVAPIGARAYGSYGPPAVYVEPAPVVVTPAPGYYGYGRRGYGPGYGPGYYGRGYGYGHR
jgi:hypothetical protein